MAELGVTRAAATRAAAEALMRRLPVVIIEDLRKTYVKREDVHRYLEAGTFDKTVGGLTRLRVHERRARDRLSPDLLCLRWDRWRRLTCDSRVGRSSSATEPDESRRGFCGSSRLPTGKAPRRISILGATRENITSRESRASAAEDATHRRR
jgi:hypothetical protein